MANRSKPWHTRPTKARRDFQDGKEYVCGGKVAFESFSLASEVAGNRRTTSSPRQPYKCPYCHKWHVGSFLVRKSLQ